MSKLCINTIKSGQNLPARAYTFQPTKPPSPPKLAQPSRNPSSNKLHKPSSVHTRSHCHAVHHHDAKMSDEGVTDRLPIPLTHVSK